MAKDLGFRKVSAILDRGTAEDAIFSELTTDFADYKIVQWNKNDIRDKAALTTVKKSGYFNSDGSKKTADSLDDYEAKITSIKSYYSTSP
jgi:hypothetical protein